MGSLKLTTASSGSVILSPANTASDVTITVPAVTGTMAYSDGSSNFQMNSGYGSNATAYGCRAWVNFNGSGTVAIRASGNVSSITDNGTGDYTVNFTTAMPDENYIGVCCAGSVGVTTAFVSNSGNTQTSSAYSIVTRNTSNTGVDATQVHVSVFR